MFENIAAIDIGTSSVKIVTVKTGLKDFQVKNFIYEDIDQENENPHEALLETLNRIVASNDLKDHKILTNLPMQNTIIRNLTFPFNDINKISEAIPFEAEENIPFKLENIILDFQLMKSKNSEEGKVLLGAAHKETIQNFLSPLKELGINPIRMDLESQALFECYRYFNEIEDEAIIQLDIGNDKTILNIIHNNELLFTRSIALGISSIYKNISESFKISYNDTKKIFEEFNLDLNSFENNLQKEYQIALNMKKNTLKNIYEKSLDIIYELIEQIVLTKKSFSIKSPDISFNRILISGGGSNIIGIGPRISRELELPVISLPFLEDYKEPRIQTQFSIAFGSILSFLNKRFSAITFLKDEFLPEFSSSSIKQYYLAGAFILLSIIILSTNIFITSFLKSESNKKYAEILNQRFKKYFHSRREAEDPISEAMKILKEEKKEFESLDSLLHSNENVIDIVNDMLSFFPKDDTFQLKNLVINESVIRLDGSIGSSRNVDEFKNKLVESKKYENVTLNTNIKKGNQIRFSMTIKKKIFGQPKKAGRKGAK